MTLVAGGAVAADGPAASGGRRPSASGTVALQRALGVAADGVIGPVTRPRDPQLPAQPRPRRRRHRRPGDARQPRHLRLDGEDEGAGDRTTGGSATLARIAQCESGGNPTAVSSHRPVPRQVPVLARHLARRSAAAATRPRPPSPSRTRWRPSCSPSAAPRPGRSAARAAQRQRSVSGSSRIRRMRAGWPALTELAGMSLVTTELVPITELSPTRRAAEDACAVADPAVVAHVDVALVDALQPYRAARLPRLHGRSRSASRGRRRCTRARR